MTTAPMLKTEQIDQPAHYSEFSLIIRSFRKDYSIGAIFAPHLTRYPGQGRGEPNILEKFQPPSKEHILGTDYLGRDVYARILFGGRSSLTTGFLVVFIAIIIGAPLGAIAGYYGGWVDELIMRITDMFLAFPALLLALATSITAILFMLRTTRQHA